MDIQSGIQAIGYILIPIGIIALFLNIKYLLYLTVFFAGFTATSIINFGNSFSLQPSYFFGMLFIIKSIFYIAIHKKIVKPNKLMLIFIALCIASIGMPCLIHQKNILIMNQDSTWTNIEFTMSNITQLIYLLFCFILYWFIKNYLYNNLIQKQEIIKILIISATVICLLGFYQEFAYLHDLPFDKFLRNGIHGNVQASSEFVRLYSVTQEPSMLAYFLIPILALSLSLEKRILKHKLIFILLIISTGIISTSTTFIIGLLALIIKIIIDKYITFINRRNINKQKIGYIFPIALFSFIVFLILIINLNPIIKSNLIDGTYNKLMGNNISGIERSYTFKTHINVASHYPFLGVGFGSARSKDLLSTWLCNIGFIATGIFIIYLYKIITKLKHTNKTGYGISNYLFVLFVCAFTAVPEPYYLFIWIMFSIGENLLRQKEDGILKQNDIGHRKLKITWGK